MSVSARRMIGGGFGGVVSVWTLPGGVMLRRVDNEDSPRSGVVCRGVL